MQVYISCYVNWDDRGNRTDKGGQSWQTIVNQIRVVRSREAANRVAARNVVIKAAVSRLVSKATRGTSKAAAAGKANARLNCMGMGVGL